MKLTLTTLIFLILSAASLHAQVTPGDSGNFITTWQTDNPGDSDVDQITIPTTGSGYNYDVYWEEVGNISNNGTETGATGDLTIDFGDAGTYQVEISGDFPRIYFDNSGDKEKILTIEQWGDIEWGEMFNAFYGAVNLEINALDAPDLSGITSMNRMFQGATSLNSDLNHWNVSGVTWMQQIFQGATAFNGNISSWDVSSVNSMRNMFFGASVFNNDISGWDVSSVTDMTRMFQIADQFNQDISGWNVSSVTTMNSMFREAGAFDQDLGGWNISIVTDMALMLDNTGLSTANYDATLIGWAGQSVQPNVELDAGGLEYCNAQAERQSLIDDDSWTIAGDALALGCNQNPFITTWKTDNSGTSNNDQITIPTSGSGYNYEVYWEDVTDAAVNGTETGTGNLTITFPVSGTYRVEVTGDFPRIYFNDGGDKEKILTIEQWGDIEWAEMENAFYGASNLEINAADAPDLSGVTNMNLMFRGATSLNSNLNNWDVSAVTGMVGLFQDATVFNGDISSWDVSGVLFMNFKFAGASAFNQDISGWDVSGVTTMQSMFVNAIAFNQDLSGWNVSNVTTMQGMLNGTSLSTANYDATLTGWSAQTVQSNVELGAFGLEYCNSEADRQSLIDDDGWIITGDALASGCTPSVGDPFITTWKTDNIGTSNDDQITIPTAGVGTYNYDVYWEDVTDAAINGTETGVMGNLTITFPAIGTYRVEITGDFSQIFFGNTGDKQKILTIEQWGDNEWTSMGEAFNGASNLVLNATDAPDLSGVTSLTGMFRGASSLSADLNHWDVSNVTSINKMFQEASNFNGDISGWDVSGVTNMSSMFAGAEAFNGTIDGWNVGNADVMFEMFSGAVAFNQDLRSWNVTSVINMEGMLDNSGLSVANYDATLTGWAGQTVQNGVELGAIGLEYCSAQLARQTLSNDFNWTITGDSPGAGCNPTVQLTGGPGFRLLSAPAEVFLNVLLAPLWTQGASSSDYSAGDPNVWLWDNNESGVNPAGWTPVTNLANTTVTSGTGVLVYVFDEDEFGDPGSAGFPKTLLVSGTLNSLPQSPTINTNPEGFTLLGNPVNAGIDWNGLTLNEVENTVYVWDPDTGDYVFWNGSTGDLTNGIIHPFQGFFVQTSAVASSPSLTIPASATTSPDDFFGKEQAEEPLVVRLQMEGEQGLGSTAWLQFSGQGSLISNRSDALKLQPLSADYAVLGLEATPDDESLLLALKHLPLEMNAPLEIPLTATTTHGGRFTLGATQMSLPDGWSLALHDTHTGQELRLEEGESYRFDLEADELLHKTSGAEGGVPLTPRPLTQPSAPTKDVGTDGSQPRFLLTITPAGAIKADLPDQVALEQNYPNPFNPTTQISYQLPQQSQVRLEVYDMVGRRVATLVDGQVGAGAHQVSFDGSNLSSGVYLYRLQVLSSLGEGGQTADAVFTKKLTLIK